MFAVNQDKADKSPGRALKDFRAALLKQLPARATVSLRVNSAHPLLRRRALSSSLWRAICGHPLESLRRRALHAESHWLSQSDGERQLRCELLRIEARRIL